jgi:U3 small nucleolar RNA-associated protein 10
VQVLIASAKVTHLSSDLERSEKAITFLTVFIESRDWAVIQPNAHMLASLMGVLSLLLARRQSVKEGIDYLEQEILGAILAVLERVTDATEVQRAHVGIEVIIKVIRASSNPRTSQRALLVASELARLIPEAVLHNVMPIFTFMGASDLQRDDAYSFGVVEKVRVSLLAQATQEAY